jgi:hypothetical protein
MMPCQHCGMRPIDDPLPEIKPVPPSKPQPRRTPQPTIEAIVYCARERGAEALNEPDNLARLRECDKAALAEIDRRIAKLKGNVQ